MNEDKKLFKWLLVILPVVVALLAIYPPSRKLKAGIDLAGGSSLLFEIDTSGLSRSEQVGLADRVMQVLKRRVDPNGQLNLVWRPIGNNRLEIQMPRPPKVALERRKAYDAARAELAALNVSRLEIEAVLNSSADVRETRQGELIHGVASREALLDALVEAHQAYVESRKALDIFAEDSARAVYEDALAKVLATSIAMGRFSDVLAMADMDARGEAIAELKKTHPSPNFAAAIDNTVETYDEWAQDKGVLEDPSDLKRRIRGAGVLEFRIMAERDLASPGTTTHQEAYLQEPIDKYVTQLQERGPRPRAGDNYRWMVVSDIVAFMNADDLADVRKIKDGSQSQVIIEEYIGKWYVLSHSDSKFGLLRDREWKLVSAFVGVDGQSGGPAVNFVLDPRGGRLFAELTGSNIGRPMIILLDNEGQSFANIQSMIRENGQITSSSFNQAEVTEMVASLRAGSLPARLIETPLMEQTIGPQLGEYNRTLGMRATVIGFVAVAIFMIVYYRFAGLVADIALMMNLLFVLGIMAAMQATFTLPGIAGLILTVGMAVDANVLIFERIREERDRGVGLKKAVRVGYERAFSTIVDANLTTLITCVVLGYLGTEEVKGFAMVLGFGVATSMFTSLFVTRVIFTSLMQAGWLKSMTMMRLLKRPQIDWLSLRRVFWPMSACAVGLAATLAITLSTTDKEALFDIEFLGGTSVQFGMKSGESLNDEEARVLVASSEPGSGSVVQWLRLTAAPAIEAAAVAPAAKPGSFTISSNVLSGEQIEALVRAELEMKVQKGGFTRASHALTIDGKSDAKLTVDMIRAALTDAADHAERAAGNLSNARIQTVRELHESADAPPAFEVITVETNKELVKTAILAVLGDRLSVERAVNFEIVTDAKIAPAGYWPIEEDAEYLSDVIEDPTANYDIRAYKGGVVIVLDKLQPPISIAGLESRLRGIRMQPEFAKFDSRPYRAIGLTSAGTDAGEEVYSRIAYTVVDENIPYYLDPGEWEESLAKAELVQIREALATEKSLQKVIQFAPQVAAQTQQQAVIAVAMALAAIICYIWIRFGQMQFGLAAIVALVHDVCIVLGLVAGAHFVYNNALGRAVGLMDFKIDLPMIAAFLTIMGYSLNDTIVIFDRIRENRGKLKTITPAIINSSINQCLSRTILTSLTTFGVVAIMYAFGGSGIHGFSFALMGGVIVGTYSSIGVATPLLYRPRVLHTIVYIMVAAGLFVGFTTMLGETEKRELVLGIAGAVIVAGLLWAIVREAKMSRPALIAGGRA